MDSKYITEISDNNYSVGEIALLYYGETLNNTIMNKIIVSTILKLHIKKYLKFQRNEQNEIIIEITNTSKEKLRISELFILECLKQSRRKANNQLTLEEIAQSSNSFFLNNKKYIKELIMQETISDGIIDKQKVIKRKKLYYISLQLLLFIVINVVASLVQMLGIISFFIISCTLAFYSEKPNELKKLKNKLIEQDIKEKRMESLSTKYIIASVVIEIIIVIVNLCVINPILDTYITNIFTYEFVTVFIGGIIYYIRYFKFNVFTDKSNEEKEKLKGLENYLREYSLIEEKGILDIYLWEEYLVYANILGVNDNIIRTFKINLN